MRTSAIFVAGLLFFLAGPVVLADVLRLSEPVASDGDTETFGQQLTEGLPGLSLTELLRNAPAHLGERVLVRTRVAKVCQKKGCFFVASEGATSVRVTFRDYAFFVPTDSAGKAVTLSGELVVREISQTEAEHFREDLGDDDAGLRPGKTYELVADAVRIPRTAPRL